MNRTFALLFATCAVLSFAGFQPSLATTNNLSARFDDWEDLRRCQLAVAPPDGESCLSCEGMPRWWVSLPYVSLQIADEPLSYFTHSGAKMSFRWSYQQRGQLTGSPRTREFSGAPYNPLIRIRQPKADWAIMTNAAWCHNWWAEILVWDPYLESSPPTAYTHVGSTPPQGDYLAYGAWFTACALPGDGGTIFYSGVQAAYNPEPGRRTRLEVIGTVSAGQGARVPAKTWNPYPTNANGVIWVTNPQYGFRIVYPDGSKDVYGFVQLVGDNPINQSVYPIPPPNPHYPIDNTARAYLTERIDPQGRSSKVGYKVWPAASGQPTYTVSYIEDPDGLTTAYTYSPDDRNQLIEIRDPYGRTATFGYGPTQFLNSITDAEGMTTSFTYTTHPVTNNGVVTHEPATGWITNMTTPYGTTRFDYFEQQEAGATSEYSKRAIWVTHPDLSHELFLYRHSGADMEPAFVDPGSVPSVSGFTFDNGSYSSPSGSNPELSFRNTYHWGPRQFAAAVPNPANWTLASGLSQLGPLQYHMAHLKHWRLDGNDPGLIKISESLSSERPPSRDLAGVSIEPRTWYGYSGQWSSPYLSVSEPLIGCVARQLPDLTTQYERRDYDWFGHLVTQRMSHSTPAGIGVLTNTFKYSTNYIDLLAASNSLGQWTTFSYNQFHQVTNRANALNQASSFTWDPWTHNLTKISPVGGATVSLAYNGPLRSMTFQPEGRVVEFADYTASLPRTVHLSGTGIPDLWFTNSYDRLNRLTNTFYTDGTSLSYYYDRLHVGAVKDRLNHWTVYNYNNREQLFSIQDARSNTTYFGWCDCGSLTSITDASNRVTSFFYNNQGLLTNVVFPDTNHKLSHTNFFDSAGRLERVTDGENRSFTIGYNNQGLRTSVSSAYGPIWRVVYDLVNRPWTATDAENVTVTNQFDLLNRLARRTWQDGISETFGYSTNGLIAYTNRNGQATRFTRDNAGRLTAMTNANLETVVLAYNALNQVTDLWDGRTNHTKWNYNQYGWLSNKLDHFNQEVVRYSHDPLGQATNRWTPQFGNTSFRYDPAGNLTNVAWTSPQPGSIGYSYDKLNQLSSMSDALGTTTFGYTANGELASESGPWADDLVSRVYKQGHRVSLGIGDSAYNFWQSYASDAAWRLTNLTSSAGAFLYGYSGANPASALVRTLVLPNFASVTNHYDSLGRLDYTALLDRWGHSLDGYGYTHDNIGLRTNIVRELGLTTNSVAVGYDAIGQLISWKAKESGGSNRLHEQFDFAFDKAGNLRHRTNGAFVQTFTNNPLNQLTNITRSGTLTVSGAIPAPATSVTVNGQSAERYGDFSFARTNLSLTGNDTFTIIAQNQFGSATNSATYSLPATVTLKWDLNGNLTNDGTRAFFYDAEDRLTNVTVETKWKTEFVHDGLGRRRMMREYGWQSGQWVKTNEVRFVWDGMVPIQERDGNDAVQVSYTRGLDLSGSLQGAGGIGGLLARTDANGSLFYHADGAGNITALMDLAGNVAGRYQYGPFGRLSGIWGPMSGPNVMRFSSMPYYDKAGISAYPFRDYDQTLQRWLTQDPLGEVAGLNLYKPFFNSPVVFSDRDGLDNIYNPRAGQNAVPDLVVSLPLGGVAAEAGYRPGEDPLFLLASLTPFDPNQLLTLPSPLNGLVALLSDGTTGGEKMQAGVGLGLWFLTKGKKCPPVKRGPKPGLKGPHNQAVKKIADELESEGNIILAGGKRPDLPEAVIQTKGGKRDSRRPDILYKTPAGEARGVNVGKTKADGSPVTREQEALGDLNVLGDLPTEFYPYDR